MKIELHRFHCMMVRKSADIEQSMKCTHKRIRSRTFIKAFSVHSFHARLYVRLLCTRARLLAPAHEHESEIRLASVQ